MSSKTTRPIHMIASLVAAASLIGCAAPSGDQDQDHAQHHPAQSASTGAPDASGGAAAQGGTAGAMTGSQAGCGMMGGSTTGGQAGCAMQQMDKEAMCAMYRSMRDAPTDQARQAMMDRNMAGMSPAMRQQHMDMMRQQCP